jgi:hypothetical protein
MLVLKRRNTVPEYVAALRTGSEGQRDDPNYGNDGQADKRAGPLEAEFG